MSIWMRDSSRDTFTAAFLVVSAVVMTSLVILKVNSHSTYAATAAATLLAATTFISGFVWQRAIPRNWALIASALILAAAIFVPLILTNDASKWAAWLADLGWTAGYVIITLAVSEHLMSKRSLLAVACGFAVALVASAVML